MRLRQVLAMLVLAVALGARSAYADDTAASAEPELANRAAPPSEQRDHGDAIGRRADSTPALSPCASIGRRADSTPALSPCASIDARQRRDPAAFRGRENYTTASETLSWIPRVLFFPLYLITEFLVRRPLIAVAGWVDRNHIVPILNDLFNPTPDIHWQPTFSLDLGVFAAVGVEGRWRNFLVRNHEIGGSVATSGLDGLQLKARDSWQIGVVKIGARGGFVTRMDRAFYGFGPDSTATDETYFSETVGEATAFVALDYRTHVHVEVSGGFRDETTGSGYQPSIQARFWPEPIPGLGEDIGLATSSLDVRLDSRMQPDQSGGLRLVGNATYARDVHDSQRSFVATSFDLTGAIEVSHPDRVLTVRGYLVDTFPLGSKPVPLLEQASLGWSNHFGFRWGRFRDESAVMAELRYRYPVGYFVDMQWVASVGNVFSHTFDDFDVGKLTGSFGVGLRTRRTGRTPIELIVALGTTRFDESFGVQSARVYLSTTEGL